MKFDIPKSPSQEDVKWILHKIKDEASHDIFTARSWLLTATSLFPSCFNMLFEAYKIERDEGNLAQCATLLSKMFQHFPNEHLLWNELKLSFQLDSNQDETVQQRIFNIVEPSLQQAMLMFFAEQQNDVVLRCKLTLLFLRKNPEAVAQYGISLAEKLVDEEKTRGYGSPLNHCRKLLVCEVLPVICKNVTGVSNKHFYKWLQKATEFYTAYFTTRCGTTIDSVGKVELLWENLDDLRQNIATQCGWEALTESKPTLQDRMNHIMDLHRRSRTDISGKINKKQIFYTAILLLMEGAIKYVKLIEPQICPNETATRQLSHVIVSNWGLRESESIGLMNGSLLSELHDCFFVARNSWSILHSNEAFIKDMNHLYKRWKMEKWTWFQLFLVDNFTFDANYRAAISRLNKIVEQDISESRNHIAFRCVCQLSSLYYSARQLFPACKSALKCLLQIGQNVAKENPTPSSHTANFLGASLTLITLTPDSLLPFWVHLFITSLEEAVKLHEDDNILGHLIVLSQHDWPRRQDLCRQTLNAISRRSKFAYPIFFDYIIITDILEEVASIREACPCELSLLREESTSQQRITRGVNKNASEEFKSAMKRQIRRSDDSPSDLLKIFFVEQCDSFLNCMQSQAPEEVLEPMAVDHTTPSP